MLQADVCTGNENSKELFFLRFLGTISHLVGFNSQKTGMMQWMFWWATQSKRFSCGKVIKRKSRKWLRFVFVVFRKGSIYTGVSFYVQKFLRYAIRRSHNGKIAQPFSLFFNWEKKLFAFLWSLNHCKTSESIAKCMYVRKPEVCESAIMSILCNKMQGVPRGRNLQSAPSTQILRWDIPIQTFRP